MTTTKLLKEVFNTAIIDPRVRRGVKINFWCCLPYKFAPKEMKKNHSEKI